MSLTRAGLAASTIGLLMVSACSTTAPDSQDAAPPPAMSPAPSASEDRTRPPAYEPTGVTARVLPQIAAVGKRPQAAADAAWVVEATVRGAAAGTPVQLFARRDGVWEAVDDDRTNRRGQVALTSTTGGRLHVVAGDPAVGVQVSTRSVPAVSFEDDFDDPGSVHGTGTWRTRAQGHVGVRLCSEAVDRAARVVGGVLRLSVMDDPTRGVCDLGDEKHAYRINGHVGTQDTYTFRHGHAAARIRFQAERGQHGAFWLQSARRQAARGPAYLGAEIDVVEYFGDGHPQGGLTSFTYWFDENSELRTRGGWVKNPERYGDDWSSKFHVFAVEWTPRGYVFRIDGEVTHRLPGPTSITEEYLILSLLSSDYELKQMEGRLPVHMDVDWVRVWETGNAR